MVQDIRSAHNRYPSGLAGVRFWCIHAEIEVTAATLIPGKLLDTEAGRFCVKAQTRLGPNETQLLDSLAAEFGISRSHLVRRLLVDRLLELERFGR